MLKTLFDEKATQKWCAKSNFLISCGEDHRGSWHTDRCGRKQAVLGNFLRISLDKAVHGLTLKQNQSESIELL
jgi:hypothetical protein